MSRYAYNLQPKGRQKSFYGKAIVVVTNDKYENTHRLYSYDTQVACLDLSDKTLKIFGWYSATTAKHIRSFLLEAFGEDIAEMREAIWAARDLWKCKSFKEFCNESPEIYVEGGVVSIMARNRPSVSNFNLQ